MASSAPDRRSAPLAERAVRADRLTVTILLASLCALGWAYLASGAAMSGAPLLVVAMWSAMMAAMMLPSAAPAILLYGRNAATHPSMGPSWHVLTGYLIAWLGFSVVAAGLQIAAMRAGMLDAMTLRAAGRISAALWIAAGLYQLTPLKSACLAQCRSPAAFFARHWRAGPLGAVRLGIAHGLFCIGCCGALMVLLLIGGVMNLLWVAMIATVVAIEKLAPRGDRIARVSGIAMLVWGAISLFR